MPETQRPALPSALSAGSWLPPDFVHPMLVPVAFGHHLRPVREDDVDLDLVAVLGSRTRLWRRYGQAWKWPPETMTREENRADLGRRADAIAGHRSFTYALFDADETAMLGHVYIDPSERARADAEISWWVVDECVGTDLETALDALVPAWIGNDWPFRSPRCG